VISLLQLILNESISSDGFIDPKGKFHETGAHHIFAQRYFEKKHNEYLKPFEAIYRLLRLGWIRVIGNNFEICKIDRNIKDFIFLFAKEHGLDKIFVELTDESDRPRTLIFDDQPIEDVFDLHENIF